jgi:RNA polymerase sigma factor (sigma-70 family)
VLGWLLVTSRRIAFDRFRRLARALRLGSAAPRAVGLDAATIERFVDLRAELARLTPAERTAILLSAVEGWSADEIGAALGVSAGAVRAAASRGRAKLAGGSAK